MARKVVFTNGCFDLLHEGHLRLLEFAFSQGDYLIVGINSDNSVKRLKGFERPINNQIIRKIMLEKIKFVDEVHIFDEDTPYDLIKKIGPNVLIKGGDYKLKDVIGADLVDEVKIFPLKEGFSSSSIIEKCL